MFEVLLEIVDGDPQYFGIISLQQQKSKIESEETTMIHIVPHLLSLIKYLNKILFKFQYFLVNRYMEKSPSDNPVTEKYCALKIDTMPIVEKRQLYDHNQLLKDYLENTARPLNLLTEEVSSYLFLVLYALFTVLLMSIFTTIPVEEVNLVVKFVNQPFIPIRPT